MAKLAPPALKPILPVGHRLDLNIGLRPSGKLERVDEVGGSAVGLYREAVGFRLEIVEENGSLRALGKGCAIGVDHRICRCDIAAGRVWLAQDLYSRHARLQRRNRRRRGRSARLCGAAGEREEADSELGGCQDSIFPHVSAPF